MSGQVESKVRSDLEALITTHPMGEALAELAYTLAAQLDGGELGMATAAVSKELRATLDALVKMREGDDDDLDAALSTPVPSEVRDTPDS